MTINAATSEIILSKKKNSEAAVIRTHVSRMRTDQQECFVLWWPHNFSIFSFESI